MGAYLSSPLTEKECEDAENGRLAYGAAAMQGWRVSQEDAHNTILDYDDQQASYFAVYDGHGGHEVAQYTAQYLPELIKNDAKFNSKDTKEVEDLLIRSFVEFDRTIIKRDVVGRLKVLAGSDGKPGGANGDGGEPDEEDEDPNEVSHLYEEATMPLEDVIHKYGSEEAQTTVLPKKHPKIDQLAGEGGSGANKPISPFLRGKRAQAIANGSSNKVKENSHIRFDENGTAVKVEPSNGTGEHKTNGETKESKSEDSTVKKEVSQTNGHVTLNGDQPQEGPDSKMENASVNTSTKGKGKGKGKSSQIKSSSAQNQEAKSEEPKEELETKSPTPEATSKRSPKKSAAELYQSIIGDEPADDDDSEDESDEDINFQGKASSDDDDDDDDEEDGDADPDDEAEESDEEEEDTEEEENGSEEFIGGDFNDEPGNDSGCTAVVALLKDRKLFVANAGDSRCVVCRNGKAVEMSFDHKPEDKPEQDRIVKAGGKVTPDGRVNGGLNLSRAIGDHAYKTNKSLPLEEQMISPVPDVKTLDIDPQSDAFMILACDGIWNSMSSQEVVDFVHPKLMALKPDEKLSSICEELFDHCLAPDTMGDGTGCDNMTAVIVRFKEHQFTTKDSSADGPPLSSETCSNSQKRPLEDSDAPTEKPEEAPPASKKTKTDEEGDCEPRNEKVPAKSEENSC